ncbi:aldehyde dehydrogenase [Bordetella genomosp. 1]|uniref:Aldehyde dehydrogenase n=1 Tax=Bordetella genomosp. 1 TaxID=1395607 RepID=A0A261STS0_9BORD|nr:aldehyde dehydrogenase family protein [Bordetella genomosp. 1]MDQ8030388.1 aldehyde dehydrogenase family protein [Bordetella sp.]OZI40260.1 aldehyde dehydrogenase [Bordetella genomosp. 1]OZI68453.1 aldehyde dehydrogenase [Bordetella genomosp. 1]
MKQHFIDNRPVAGSSGESIDVIDPSTGETFDQLARGNAADIDLAVQAARRAYEGAWGKLSAAERGRLMLKLAVKILDHHDELTQIESRDCGKPIKQARADVTAVARYFEFYGGAADKLMGETIPYQAGYTVLTVREPHGVTGHIVPWNYPLQIFGRSIGGALAAGNACVVKPAEDACLSILRVAELAAEVGFPAGALNIVTGYGHEAGDALTRHPGVDHISFTGSPRVGVLVTQTAAERHVPVTLELGGKSPQIIFADADLDALVPVAVNAIVQNAGQTCSAGSRLVIERSIYDKLMDRLAQAFSALRTGAGSADLDCGPLIRQTQLERVQRFLRDAEAEGIQKVAQGQVVADAPKGGFFQAPTLLGNVPVEHRLAQEEIFGPVLVAIPFDDEADAIRIANATEYGLAASVWTRDGARQLRVARKVRSGQVFINNYGAGGGVELPFGGVKASGHGREKGFEALYGFTVLKTIAIKHD